MKRFFTSSRKKWPDLLMERRLLGVATLLLLLSFIYKINSINAPGILVLTSTAFVLIAIVVEYFKPWLGFYIFFLVWPSMWVIRELLGTFVDPYLNVLPDLWGAPLAAALTFTIWLRSELLKYESMGLASRKSEIQTNNWLLAFRIPIWGLVLSYTASCFFAMQRMRNPPDGWVITFDIAPLLETFAYLPPLLLGLMLLNFLSQNSFAHEETNEDSQNGLFVIPHQKMIISALIGAVPGLIVLLYQLRTGYVWGFNSGDPYGGFLFSRNITAPFLIIIGILFFYFRVESYWKQFSLYAMGVAFLIFSVTTQSRNAVFMLVCTAMGVMLIRASRKRILYLVLSGTMIVFLLVILIPYLRPHLETLVPALSRTFSTIDQLTGAGFSSALGSRWLLNKASLLIFHDYPFFGSGPGTFGMLVAEGARYGNIVGRYHLTFAHSMPLNLLSETGIQGMLSWSAAWLLLPLTALIRWKNGGVLALALFAFGAGNLFDTAWRVPGMTTFSVLLIVWACSDEFKVLSRIKSE